MIKFKVVLETNFRVLKEFDIDELYSIYIYHDNVKKWTNSLILFLNYTKINITLLFKCLCDNYRYHFNGSTIYFENKKDAEEVITLIDQMQVMSMLME